MSNFANFNDVKFPLCDAAVRKIEGGWALAVAIAAECSETGDDGVRNESYAKMAAMQREIAKNHGVELGFERIRKLRKVASAFPAGRRRPGVSLEAHLEAGTPEVLDAFVSGAPSCTPPTRDNIRQWKQPTKQAERGQRTAERHRQIEDQRTALQNLCRQQERKTEKLMREKEEREQRYKPNVNFASINRGRKVMPSIIDDVLVDLFSLFDGEIRPKFHGVRREAKMAIALGIFREFGWAVEIFGDDGRVNWQTTPKLSDDIGKVRKQLEKGSSVKEVGKMFKSVPVQRCLPMTKKEAEEQYARYFAKIVRNECVGVLLYLSVLIGLSVRGLIVRLVDEDGQAHWLLAPEALNRPQPLVELQSDPNGRRRISPTREGLDLIFGTMTADECKIAERLLRLESGSLGKGQLN